MLTFSMLAVLLMVVSIICIIMARLVVWRKYRFGSPEALDAINMMTLCSIGIVIMLVGFVALAI